MFDITTKRSRMSEKRTMLDIHVAPQTYKAQEISKISFVRSSRYLADGLTRPKIETAQTQLLPTAYHKPQVEQLTIRDPR